MKLDSIALYKVCEPVDFSNTKKNLKFAHQLIKLMQEEKGVGLAANQCGLSMRLFVMKINDRFYHCFNPEIIEFGKDNVASSEGCLSFLGKICTVSRPYSIKVKYFSAQGQETVEWLAGLAARCFQHELDHLNGITMFDRL